MIRITHTLILALALPIAILFMSAGAAAEESPENKNYIIAGIGITTLQNNADDTGSDIKPIYSFSYGRFIREYLTVEGDISYFKTENTASGANQNSGAYTINYELEVTSVNATVNGVYPMEPLSLFAGVGAGGYFAKSDASVKTSLRGSPKVTAEDFVFGVHAAVGASYDITPRIFIAAKALYRWTDEIDTQKSAAGVTVGYKDSLNGYAISLMGGLRF